MTRGEGPLASGDLQEPPPGEPPSEEPPVQEPPAGEPPAGEPPAEEPPSQEPPVEEPAPEEPPVQEPPVVEPPSEDPPPVEPAETGPQEGETPPEVDAPLAGAEEGDEDGEAEFDFDRQAIIFERAKGQKPKVIDLLEAVQIHLERTVIPEKDLDTDTEITFIGPASLTYSQLRIVLESYDVKLLHEKSPDGSEIIRALSLSSRGGIQGKTGGPNPVGVGGLEDSETPQFVTQIYRLQYAGGQSLSNTLRTLKRPSQTDPGVALYDQDTNSFIIRDTRDNVEYLINILEALDLPPTGRVFKVVTLEFASSETVAAIIDSTLRGPGVAGRRAQPRPRPGQPQGAAATGQLEDAEVVSDPRTNKIIIWALPEDLEEIERLIQELDVQVPFKRGKLRRVPLENTQAEELAQVLNAVISGSPLEQPGGGQQPTPGAPRPQTPQRTARPQTGQFQSGGGAVGEVATRVVPDAQTNSLIIQAEPDVFDEIRDLISQLDQKKNQIFIEAQIWEVGVDNTLDLGVELATLDRPVPGETRGAGITNFGLTTVTVDDPANPTQIVRTPNFTEGATTFILQGAFDRVPFVLNALARSSNARILSTPFAVTNDNETATFTITDTVPFQTSTLAGSGVSQGGFDFVDATTVLEIEPTISSENRLRLRVIVDIQTFTATSQGGTPPPSNSRRYEGTLTVPDRKYVVVGGLEQEEAIEDVSKVPILGDIPLLGLLFQSRQTIKRRARIYFFVRPSIFVDPEFKDITRVTDGMQGNLKRFSPFDYDGEVLKYPKSNVHEKLDRLFPDHRNYSVDR